MTNNNILEVKQFTYNSEVNEGNSGTAKDLDWTASHCKRLVLTGACTITETLPTGPCRLTLRLDQDVTGSRTLTPPATWRFAGGSAPTLTTTPCTYDLWEGFFDGTSITWRVFAAGVPWTEAEIEAWVNSTLTPVAWYWKNHWTLNGSDVSQWDDLSSNARHATQSTADDQPAGVDDTDDYCDFDNDDGTNGDALACNAAFAALSGLAGAAVLTAYQRSDTSTGTLFVGDTSDLAYLCVTTAASRVYVGGAYVNYAAASASTNYVDLVYYDGTQATNTTKVRLWRDGSELTSTADSGTVPTTLPTMTAGQFGRGGASTNPFDGRLYLSIILGYTPTAAQLTTLNDLAKVLLAFY
jgi:hypothetical protein